MIPASNHRRSIRSIRPGPLFVGLLFLLPLIALFLQVAQQGSKELFHFSDQAVLEVGVQQACKGVRFVGPYSRFQWNHPGPAYFYLLVPFYWLYHMGTQSLHVGALFINLCSVLTILLVAARNGGRRWLYFVSIVTALYIWHFLEFTTVADTWNPFVTILPLGATLFLSAGLASGDPRTLPWLALFSSFLIQTHVGYAPVVLSAAVYALAFHVFGERPASGEKATVALRRERGWYVAALFVLAVMWALPIIEQITHSPGNMSRILAFFASAHGHNLGDAFTHVARLTAVPLLKILKDTFQISGSFGQSTVSVHVVLFFLQVLLGGATWFLCVRRRRRFCAHLLTVGLIGVGLSIISVSRIVGSIHPYLILWISVIGLVNWIGIACGLVTVAATATGRALGRAGFHPDRSARRWGAVVAALLLAVAALWLYEQQKGPVHKASRLRMRLSKEVQVTSGAIREYIKRKHIKYVEFTIPHGLWGYSAGVINRLYKLSVPMAVEDRWVFMFGRALRKRRPVDHALLFRSEKRVGGNRSDYTLVYRNNARNVSVYDVNVAFGRPYRTAPGEHMFKGAVKVANYRGVKGDPGLAVDKKIPPTGTRWNARACLVLQDKKSFVTLRVPRPTGDAIVGVVVSADDNDEYRLQTSDDGVHFRHLGMLPSSGRRGMTNRFFFSNVFTRTKYLRIGPAKGDARYSIGEVGFLMRGVE